MMKKTYSNPLHEWFKYLFDIRKDSKGIIKCYECNYPLHEETYKEISTCYSHILSKKEYPLLAGNPDNVVITCPNCHNLYTMKPKCAKKQYSLYVYLKQLYNLN